MDPISKKHTYKESYEKSRCDYYERKVNINTIEDLKSFLKIKNRTYIKTESKIKFKNIEFGTPHYNVIEILGKPKFTIHNNSNMNDHFILFYKYKIEGYKTIAQLHFIEKIFCIGQYFFNPIKANQINVIKNLLKIKYLNTKNLNLDGKAFFDNENNRIELENDVLFVTNYISGKKKVIDLINNEMIIRNKKIKSIEKKNLKVLYDLL